MSGCRFPGCRRGPVHLAALPFSERHIWVCQRHHNWFVLLAMRALVA